MHSKSISDNISLDKEVDIRTVINEKFMTLEQKEVLFLIKQAMDEKEKQGLIISRDIMEEIFKEIEY